MVYYKALRYSLLNLFILFFVLGCAQKSRLGMVKDPDTGLQYGSIVEKNIFMDSGQFQEPRLKLKIRNTSGDTAFSLYDFTNLIENSYSKKGYLITTKDDYNILIDLNILYSGQITEDMTAEYAFLGASAGGIAGYRSNTEAGTAAGIVSGFVLGAITGSHIQNNTYIIISEVNIGIIDLEREKSTNTIVFSSSHKESTENESSFRRFRQKLSTKIATYAGGTNIHQSEIVNEVQKRMAWIVADII